MARFLRITKTLFRSIAIRLRAMTPDEIIEWQMQVEKNGNWSYYSGVAQLFGIKLF